MLMLAKTIIPAHVIGQEILRLIDRLLDFFGFDRSPAIETAAYIIIIVGIAILLGLCIRKLILMAVRKVIEIRHNDIGDELLKAKVFTKCSHIIPPIVIMAMIPIAFDQDDHLLEIIERLVISYGLVTLAVGINSIVSFFWLHYNNHENKNNHPIRGILNTAHGVVWIVISIIIISVLVDKSPTTLLAGLGAFAAALMLIFKDSILGLVAGIQMSQNDMLRVGDWIVVPGTPANGTVMEVTLTVVKVKNWDNTFVYLPPYTLVSTSFQNWREMYVTGARQIERSVYIDNASIVPISQTEIDAISGKVNLKEFTDFITDQRKNLAEGKGTLISGATAPVNGNIETNLGLFRAYLGAYLRSNPNIANDSYLIVRTLEQTAYGTPLQLYCYSVQTHWTAYEAVRSDVFEHVAAMAPLFGLTIYNNPDRNSFSIVSKEPAAEQPSQAHAPEQTAATGPQA